MIKFSHTIFALPFALSSLFLATQGRPKINSILLIIFALLFARSAAMAFNRFVDSDIDKKNPRTASRHLPSGLLTKRFVLLFTVLCSLAFIFTTYFINKLSFWLSPVALFIVFFYSFTKRFTHLTQFFLGLALGIAPIAAWIAASNSVSLTSIYLGLAVFFWVSGFDIIYATQDYEFDKNNQIGSLVVKLGIQRSLSLSKLLHLACFFCLLLTGFSSSSGVIYYIFTVAVGFLFIYEHHLVSADDLSKVNAAFFTTNGIIGIIYFVGIILDQLKLI